MNAVKLAFKVGAVEFVNPVFLASGPAGYGLEYDDLIDLRSLGGIVTKTITLEPRRGNPGRRLWETNAGLLNSVGLENVGAERFLLEKLPSLLKKDVKAIVSVAAESWHQYEKLIHLISSNDNVKIVELNLSCPNVDEGGMMVGIDPLLVGKYVRKAVDVLTTRLIIAKLTPNVTDICELARAAEEGGASAITAINTVTGMEIECDRRKPVFRRVSAGLSGPAVLPVALDAVWKVTRCVNIPVFGVGGISTVEDARKFFMAGAAAVQIGTAIFYDPELPERIIENLQTVGIPEAI